MTITPRFFLSEISRTSLKAENSVVNFSENHRLLRTIKSNFASEDQSISTGLKHLQFGGLEIAVFLLRRKFLSVYK